MVSESKIFLPENHRRSLSSTLMIVEQLLIEMEELMINQHASCCFEIKNDLNMTIVDKNRKVIDEALKLICSLAEKYGTELHTQSLQRIIDVKKEKMWEILCDSKAKKLKGFGDFPQKLIKEFDKDIDELIAITNKIKC
jgi:hypothetical protein